MNISNTFYSPAKWRPMLNVRQSVAEETSEINGQHRTVIHGSRKLPPEATEEA